jgi:hypothetical protein
MISYSAEKYQSKDSSMDDVRVDVVSFEGYVVEIP